MKPGVACTLLLCSSLLQLPAHAWDAVGHRLSVAVALNYISAEKQQLLLQLLAQHPRYQADFIEAMPASVQTGSTNEQQQWLLGQAAYWPDIARGLPDAEATRFNRPAWHFIDGAWVRDGAIMQGNMYIGLRSFADIAGESADSIRTEAQVQNIMSALDYNTRMLADASLPMPERAVALCWVLHLIGDIHQPLHAGSLYSPTLFADGDRGGNRITTDNGNLHARWDRALTDSGLISNLNTILQEQTGLARPRINDAPSDWSQWLAESRNLLLTVVYNDTMQAAIVSADQQGSALPPQQLDASYVTSMERLSRQRLGLAGLRIAIWIENEL